MTTRRRAREIVLQMLYEEDLHPEHDTKVADHFLVTRLHGNRPLVEFARNLFRNILANRKQIDKALSARASNWSLRRMAAIDRNILRMGAYEILLSDTPGRVVINEAIELAKRYGDRQSGQFVNGILDRLLHSPTDETTTSGEKPTGELATGELATGELATGETTGGTSDSGSLDLNADDTGKTITDLQAEPPKPSVSIKTAEVAKQRPAKLKVATSGLRN